MGFGADRGRRGGSSMEEDFEKISEESAGRLSLKRLDSPTRTEACWNIFLYVWKREV